MTKLYHSGIERNITSRLLSAKRSIKIAVAWFTNPELFKVILKKREQGLIVYLLLSDDLANYTAVDFQHFINKGGVLRITKSPRFMHNKFCVIDERIVISGSYNWSLKAENFNFENVIISEDEKLVQDFLEYFDQLKFQSVQVNQIDQISFSKYDESGGKASQEKVASNPGPSLKSEESSIENYPQELRDYIIHAEKLYLETKLKEGLEYAREKLIVFPDIPEFHQVIAKCYWRMGLYEEMIRSAEKVLSIKDFDIDAYNLIGIGYSFVKGRRVEALGYFNRCLEARPNSHEVLINRGKCYMELANDFARNSAKREDFQNEARKDFERIENILKKNSGKREYSDYYSLAIAEVQLGKLSLASKI